MRNLVRSKLSPNERAFKELCIEYEREDLLTGKYGRSYRNNEAMGLDCEALRTQQKDFINEHRMNYESWRREFEPKKPKSFSDKMGDISLISIAAALTLTAVTAVLGATGHTGALLGAGVAGIASAVVYGVTGTLWLLDM